MIGVEQFLDAIDRQLLDLIHYLAAAVIPLVGQPFRVLVGEGRAHRFENGLRNEVLAGDELESAALALDFTVDQARDFRIGLSDVAFRHRAARDASLWWCLGLRRHVFSESIF